MASSPFWREKNQGGIWEVTEAWPPPIWDSAGKEVELTDKMVYARMNVCNTQVICVTVRGLGMYMAVFEAG